MLASVLNKSVICYPTSGKRCPTTVLWLRHVKNLLIHFITTLHYIRLMTFFQDNLGRHQKSKPFSILLEQEMMGWQWHQLDHMKVICTSLQTENHASTSPLRFYRPDALNYCGPTNSVKALKHSHWFTVINHILHVCQCLNLVINLLWHILANALAKSK